MKYECYHSGMDIYSRRVMIGDAVELACRMIYECKCKSYHKRYVESEELEPSYMAVKVRQVPELVYEQV